MHCSCSFIIDHSISALQLQFYVQDLCISALQLHFYVLITVFPIIYSKALLLLFFVPIFLRL